MQYYHCLNLWSTWGSLLVPDILSVKKSPTMIASDRNILIDALKSALWGWTWWSSPVIPGG